MMKSMLESANEPVTDLSYFECLDSVMEKSKVGYSVTVPLYVILSVYSNVWRYWFFKGLSIYSRWIACQENSCSLESFFFWIYLLLWREWLDVWIVYLLYKKNEIVCTLFIWQQEKLMYIESQSTFILYKYIYILYKITIFFLWTLYLTFHNV